jgi:hypothetical protein
VRIEARYGIWPTISGMIAEPQQPFQRRLGFICQIGIEIRSVDPRDKLCVCAYMAVGDAQTRKRW